MSNGIFVTFEGGEGSGKSTQIELLTEDLVKLGLTVVRVREPGGTPIGDRVRELLLDPQFFGQFDYRAELLLYEASRAQLIFQEIVPPLNRGEVVLCDRYFDSTMAYQGYGRQISTKEIGWLNWFAAHEIAPDLTFLNDIDPKIGIERATGQGADRLEQEDMEFHVRVRQGFLEIARLEPKRFHVIDASQTIEEMHTQTLRAFMERFGDKLGK